MTILANDAPSMVTIAAASTPALKEDETAKFTLTVNVSVGQTPTRFPDPGRLGSVRDQTRWMERQSSPQSGTAQAGIADADAGQIIPPIPHSRTEPKLRGVRDMFRPAGRL